MPDTATIPAESYLPPNKYLNNQQGRKKKKGIKKPRRWVSQKHIFLHTQDFKRLFMGPTETLSRGRKEEPGQSVRGQDGSDRAPKPGCHVGATSLSQSIRATRAKPTGSAPGPSTKRQTDTQKTACDGKRRSKATGSRGRLSAPSAARTLTTEPRSRADAALAGPVLVLVLVLGPPPSSHQCR